MSPRTQPKKEYCYERWLRWRSRRYEALKRDGFKCRHCPSRKDLQVHHIVPLEKGGTDDLSNLLTLCDECHKTLNQIEQLYEGNHK